MFYSLNLNIYYSRTVPIYLWNSSNEDAKLYPSDAQTAMKFGIAVSVSDKKIAVGLGPILSADKDETGKVYIFEKQGATWVSDVENDILYCNDSLKGDNFGTTVAISNNNLIVGAPFKSDINENSGAVYLFTNSISVGTTEVEHSIHLYPNPSEGTFFIESKQDIHEIQIYNSVGKLITSTNSSNINFYQFSVETSGIYYVKFKIEQKEFTKKVVILNKK